MTNYSLSAAQKKVVQELDKALLAIGRAGLVLRVYDGEILVTDERNLKDPRYGEGGATAHEWVEDCTTTVGRGVNADGGAGY